VAVTTVDNRSVVADAASLTNWSGGDALDTTRAEGTNSVAKDYNIATGTIYYTPGTALNLDGDLLYIRSYCNALQNGWSNSSHMLYMNDGTNELALCQAGNDRDVFKHAKGEVGFQSFVIDLDELANKNTAGEVYAIAGSVASFVKTSVDDVGSRFVTLSKALGGGNNCFVDIIRVDDLGSNSGISIYGGTTGDRGTLAEVVLDDESIAADDGYGVIREYTPGSYGCQGILKFGTTAATANAYFQDTDFNLTFEDRDIADDKYKIFVYGNSTDTNDFQLDSGIIASAGPGVELDMDSTEIDVLSLTNINFKDLKRVANFPTDTVTGSFSHTVENNIFDNQGKITVGTVDFDNNSIINSASTDQAVEIGYDVTALNMIISGYEGTAGTGALNWNVNADPDGNIDGSSFIMGTALTHAIEFSASAPLTMTLTDVTVSGYSASNGVNNSTLYFADRGSDVTWTVSLTDCTGTFSYRKGRAGDTVNIAASVPVTITVKDKKTLTVIQNAQTSVWATDDRTQIMNEDTNASGVATEAYTGSTPRTVEFRVRKSDDLDDPRYFAESGIAEIQSSTGLALTVLLEVNPFLPT
jgi:hypothetical protein